MKALLTGSSSRQAPNLDSSMVPAINIVFLLLTFFMIAGHIEASHPNLTLPASLSQEEIIADSLEIAITADGDYSVNGTLIQNTLADYFGQRSITAETALTIYADRTLPASAIDPILTLARQYQIKELQIAVEQQP